MNLHNTGAGARPQFFWDDLGDANFTNLQTRVPQHVGGHMGQVVRGIIPGMTRYTHTHNPYLQHLYRNTRQNGATSPGNVPAADHPDSSVVIDLESQGQGPSHIQNQGGELDVFEGMDRLEQLFPSSQNAGGNSQAHGHSHHAHGSPVDRDINQNTEADGGNHGHVHRDTSRQVLDWKVLLHSGIFVLILFLRMTADHILGLLVFIGLSAGFYYANLKMIHIVHQSSLREPHSRGQIIMTCSWLVIFLSAHIACIYYMFSDQELWRVLYFCLPLGWQGDLFALFWVTVVTDYMLKFLSIILKSVVSIVPHSCLPQKKRGRYYMFIEILLQLYRSILPIVPWLHFLFDQPKSGKLIFAGLLVGIYLIAKCYGVFKKLMELKNAFLRLRVDTIYGSKPNLEEIQSRGENCPICQDDYQDPVMLACKHIFCENCVSIWFDRERTCPMCRSQIQSDNPAWRDGSTSAHLQWY